MKIITLTFKDNSEVKFTIPAGGVNWVFYKDSKGFTTICDGIHNNGGWVVRETPEQITELLSKI